MNKEEIEKIYKSPKFCKKVINTYLFNPAKILARRNGKTVHQELLLAVKSIIHKYDNATQNLIYKNRQIKQLRKRINQLENKLKELEKRPTFYYDNNRNTYAWCCRCSDSNMSLHMFLENGEIQQYASEHYDKWCENAKEVKEIDVCEFMHDFVKLLIKEKNTLENKVKEREEIAQNESGKKQ